MPKPKKSSTTKVINPKAESVKSKAKEKEKGPGRKWGAAYQSVATRIAYERLTRLQNQNTQLKLRIWEMAGRLVPLEELKAEVLLANARVRSRLGALPATLAPRVLRGTVAEAEEIIRTGIRDALMELAYEREYFAEHGVLPACPRDEPRVPSQ